MKGAIALREAVNAPIANDCTGTTITAAAYVTLVASTSKSISGIEVQNTSAKAIKIAIGAAAAEVDIYVIAPGVNGVIFPKTIPAKSRISAKALGADAVTGFLIINQMA